MKSLIEIDDSDIESLAQDLSERWGNYPEVEHVQRELEGILWVFYRLGWTVGFGDCHKEWELERQANEKSMEAKT
jgi:hypothetical protein